MPDRRFDFSALMNNYESYEKKINDNVLDFKKKNNKVLNEPKTTDVETNPSDSTIANNLLNTFKNEDQSKSVNETENITKEKVDVGEFLSLGMDVYNASKNVSSSEAESWAQTANLTMKGVQMGNKVGGPLGAAVGGVLGAGYGTYDMIADQGKRADLANEKYRNSLNENSTRREQEQRMRDGQTSLKKLETLKKAQLGYLNLNY